jgi:hypothetical protein
MQKHRFRVTCPVAIFMESIPVPPKNEKLCVNISHPGCSRTHYVTHISHWMEKHKFSVTCLSALF